MDEMTDDVATALLRSARPTVTRRAKTRRNWIVLAAVWLAACSLPTPDPTAEIPPPPPPAPVQEPTRVDVTVGPGFPGADARGTAGGVRDAATWGPGCRGFVAERPNHVIRITEPQTLTLAAAPHGRGFIDLMMVLVDPQGGIWCADDGDTLNPVLAREFEAGDWGVYVGVHTPEYPPYTLSVAPGVQAPPPLSVGQTIAPIVESGEPVVLIEGGTAGGVRFSDQSAAVRLHGTVSPTRAATALAPDCAGQVAIAADHILELLTTTEVTIRVDAAVDTTLAIEGERDLVLCRDDDDGLAPVLRQLLPAGRYGIYVGVWDAAEAGPYTLTISR